MITIKRLGGQEVVLNAHLIEMIESTPDTTITMTTGRKIISTESVHDIIEKSIEYNKKIFSNEIKN